MSIKFSMNYYYYCYYC